MFASVILWVSLVYKEPLFKVQDNIIAITDEHRDVLVV